MTKGPSRVLACATFGCDARLPADQMYIDQTKHSTAFYPLCPACVPGPETLERHEYTDAQGRRVYWLESVRFYPGSGQRVGRQVEWGYVDDRSRADDARQAQMAERAAADDRPAVEPDELPF